MDGQRPEEATVEEPEDWIDPALEETALEEIDPALEDELDELATEVDDDVVLEDEILETAGGLPEEDEADDDSPEG